MGRHPTTKKRELSPNSAAGQEIELRPEVCMPLDCLSHALPLFPSHQRRHHDATGASKQVASTQSRSENVWKVRRPADASTVHSLLRFYLTF